MSSIVDKRLNGKERITWENNETPLNATNMNNIEERLDSVITVLKSDYEGSADGSQILNSTVANNGEIIHNEATGKYSTAAGEGTIAHLDNEFVVGKYNAKENDSLFVVGSGNETERKNALRVGAGSTTINGQTTLEGPTTIKNSATIEGSLTLNDSITIEGTTELNDSATLNGTTTINDSLNINGDINASSDRISIQTRDGNLSINNGLVKVDELTLNDLSLFNSGSVNETSLVSGASGTTIRTRDVIDGNSSTIAAREGKITIDGNVELSGNITVPKLSSDSSDNAPVDNKTFKEALTANHKTLTIKQGEKELGTYNGKEDKEIIIPEAPKPEAVLYTYQDLDDDQKAQARANIGIDGTGGGNSNLFVQSDEPENAEDGTVWVDTDESQLPDNPFCEGNKFAYVEIETFGKLSGSLTILSAVSDSGMVPEGMSPNDVPAYVYDRETKFLYKCSANEATSIFTQLTLGETPEMPEKICYMGDKATKAYVDNLFENAGSGGGNSIEIDATLTKEGQAADAKAVGDALAKTTKLEKLTIYNGNEMSSHFVYDYTIDDNENSINDLKFTLGTKDTFMLNIDNPSEFSGHYFFDTITMHSPGLSESIDSLEWIYEGPGDDNIFETLVSAYQGKVNSVNGPFTVQDFVDCIAYEVYGYEELTYDGISPVEFTFTSTDTNTSNDVKVEGIVTTFGTHIEYDGTSKVDVDLSQMGLLEGYATEEYVTNLFNSIVNGNEVEY